MVIREATKEDNRGLLSLTRNCPMEGIIRLLIDRKPDFFSLLRIKGDYKVFVAEANSEIIGSFALVIKKSYINHGEETTGYLCDLKIAPSYRNTLAAFRLLKAMYLYMQTLPIDFYLCVTARGNYMVEKLMKGRAGIPAAYKLADFNVFQFLPLQKLKRTPEEVKPYEQHLHSDAVALLNQYFKHYQFATVFHNGHDIAGDMAWMVLERNQLVAFLSVVDMEPYKQNIALSIPFYLKVLLRLFSFIWPFIKYTKEKEPIKMLYVKYLAFAPQYEHLVLALLNQARHYTYKKGYSFLSYGLDERNALNRELQSVPKISFYSSGYVFDFSSTDRFAYNSLCHDNFYQV